MIMNNTLKILTLACASLPLCLTACSGSKTPDDSMMVICTQDVKECLDGSFVSRIGPDCEFAKCSKHLTKKHSQ